VSHLHEYAAISISVLSVCVCARVRERERQRDRERKCCVVFWCDEEIVTKREGRLKRWRGGGRVGV